MIFLLDTSAWVLGGRNRAVAATAAEHGLPVLHCDSDYERLAEVTGAAHERAAPRGDGHGSS